MPNIGRSLTSGQRSNSLPKRAESLRISSEARANLGRDIGRVFISKIAPAEARAIEATTQSSLELVPEELVINFVMELHFLRLHKSTEQARAAVRRRFFQVSVAALHIFAKQLRCPRGVAEILNRRVDVVRQIALRLAEVLDLRRVAVETRLEDGMQHHIRIGIRSHSAHFYAHALLVADRNADHRAAIHCRRLELIRSFEVRIEAAVRVDARIHQQAKIIAMRQNAVHEVPAKLGELFLSLRIPENVLTLFTIDTFVCMPLPFTPTTGF